MIRDERLQSLNPFRPDGLVKTAYLETLEKASRVVRKTGRPKDETRSALDRVSPVDTATGLPKLRNTRRRN